MRRQLAGFITATDAGSRLLLAAEGEHQVDPDARTITGLVAPYGKAGQTSGGRLKFSAGSLAVTDPKRVKLLREHSQNGDVIGYGTEFVDTPAGLVGTFHVPATEAGDKALAEAALGLRDAFSVGVQLDDATLARLRRSQGAAVEAAGQLREVSLVSVPAFDDARMSAGAADLVVSSWTTIPPNPTPTAGAAGTTPTGDSTMDEAQRARLAALITQASLTDAERTELDQLQQLATAAGILTTAAGAPVTPPAVVPAVAGAAHVTSEPATYNFSSGDSLVRDLYMGALRGDAEAAQRVARFNAELLDENPASVVALATAAATRDDVDGAGTDLPSMFQPNPNRPELMRSLIDAKRPFISRLDRVPITNAQPFAIPSVGRFTGVGAHTEGTPHRPAGTLTLGGDSVQPTATSGAWEASRELLDAATPVLDRIAVREMLKDYQRQSEGKLIALLAARAAEDDGNVYNVATLVGLRGALQDFVNDDEEAADLVAVSKSLLKRYGAELDGDNRPMLPFVTPVNAVGSMRAGYTGFGIDGVEVFRAARLDAGVGADTGVMARSDGILWGESPVQQFRFDEVLGPGVIKLALWAYNAAAILDTADVAILNFGADPTP